MNNSLSPSGASGKRVKSAEDFKSLDPLQIVSQDQALALDRLSEARFMLQIPGRWRAPLPVNVHAEELGVQTTDWIASLGCPEWQVRRAHDFQASLYIGIPFASLGFEKALLISKFTSLWLLWDDVEVENNLSPWRIELQHVLSGNPPADASIYDLGWLALFRELAASMSRSWLTALIQIMVVWTDEAHSQAQMSRLFRDQGQLPTYSDCLLTRISTIGMYAMSRLIEYAMGVEFPEDFFRNPILRRMQTLSNVIVGLGNDIFSFPKDYADNFINVILVLAGEHSIPFAQSFARIIELFNETICEYDELENKLPSFGSSWDPQIRIWVQELRYCALGLTVWESQAPRYNRQKILCGGKVLETGFLYL